MSETSPGHMAHTTIEAEAVTTTHFSIYYTADRELQIHTHGGDLCLLDSIAIVRLGLDWFEQEIATRQETQKWMGDL